MAEVKKLPVDLPENWQLNQAVTPNGTEAGLDEKHGYNYLMKQVNVTQVAVNSLDEKKADKTSLAATDKALGALQTRVDNIREYDDTMLRNYLDDLMVTIASRVDMLENVIFNDINTNPYLIMFDDLVGIVAGGVWNESLQRIEC